MAAEAFLLLVLPVLCEVTNPPGVFPQEKPHFFTRQQIVEVKML
jgi:hypothetical protein